MSISFLRGLEMGWFRGVFLLFVVFNFLSANRISKPFVEIGNNGYILDFTTNSKYYIISSETNGASNSVINIFDKNTNKLLHKIVFDNTLVRLHVVKNNKLIFVGYDGKINLYKLKNASLIKFKKINTTINNSIIYKNKLIILANHKLYIYNTNNLKLIKKIKLNGEKIKLLSASKYINLTIDNKINVLDIFKNKKIIQITNLNFNVIDYKIDYKKKQIIIIGKKGYIEKRDIKTNKIIFRKKLENIRNISILDNQNIIFIEGKNPNYSLNLFNLNQKKVISKYKFSGYIYPKIYLSDEDYLPNAIKIINKKIYLFFDKSYFFSKNSFNFKHFLQIFNIKNNNILPSIKIKLTNEPIYVTDFTKYKSYVIIGDSLGEILFWKNGKLLKKYSLKNQKIFKLLSDDNKIFILTKSSSYTNHNINIYIYKNKKINKIYSKNLHKTDIIDNFMYSQKYNKIAIYYYNYLNLSSTIDIINIKNKKIDSITEKEIISDMKFNKITNSIDYLSRNLFKNYNLDTKKVDSVNLNETFHSFAYKNNEVVYLSNDNTIVEFNLKSQKKILRNTLFNYVNGDKIIKKVSLLNNNIIATTTYGKIYILNSSNLKQKYTLKISNSSIKNICFNKNNLMTIENRENFSLWNYIKKQKYISFYIFKKNQWLTITPKGFFTGTPEAAKHLNITKYTKDGMEPFDFSQLYDHFFRPDLVKLKLSGDEEAYQKAIKGMSYQEALKNPPPKLSFKSVDDKKAQLDGFEYKSVDTTKERVKLTFNVKQSENGGVGLVRVYQEGKLIQTIGEGKVNKQSANLDTTLEQEKLDSKAKEAQKEYLAMLSKAIDRNVTLNVEDTIAKYKTSTTQNKEGDYTIELELKSGSNDISIEAFNKTNTVTSYREHITINANIPKQKPKLYAIVVGVNEFEAPSVHNLKYSQNDAKAIKELLEQKAKSIYADVEVKYLIGKDATKANILKSAKEIAQKAKLEDTVLFFISTHGRAVKGKLYLVPQNNKLVSNWIDFEQTFKAIQSIKALNQIFIVDACESGKANDIVSSVYDSRASVLAKSSGVHMLLATTKGTSAFESNDPNIKNSLFTYKILKALKDKKTDLNKDNFISIAELSKVLKNSQNSSEYQYPVIRNVGKDVILERIK